jgi:hypothetical protein
MSDYDDMAKMGMRIVYMIDAVAVVIVIAVSFALGWWLS